MIFLIFENLQNEHVIPNGFNMSTSEFEYHLYKTKKNHNLNFKLPATPYYFDDNIVPLSVSSYLASQDFFDHNGKVFYVHSLNRNIKEYPELFLPGMNNWINFCNPKIIELVKESKITLVLECLIEDIDSYSVSTIVGNLKFYGIKNFQIWTCFTFPENRYVEKNPNFDSYIVDVPYQEKITLEFYPYTDITSLKTKKYIYLCRRVTDDRAAYFSFLVDNNLLDQGFVSMPSIDSMTGQPIIDWVNHPDRSFNKLIKNILLDYFKSNPQGLRLDTDIVDDVSRLNNPYMGFVDPPNLEPYYAQSYLSLIAEGSLARNQYMVTEKTYRAILYKHMFFILGPRYLIKTLHRRGYKTFGSLWDEGYDDVPIDEVRLTRALEEFKRVLTLDLEELHKKAMPILEHNFNVLQERSKMKLKLR